MGMPSASVQQSPNPSNGKGMAQPMRSGPIGDFGDPNFDNPRPLPAQLGGMANQLTGGQFVKGPSNNGQWDATEGGGLSGIGTSAQYQQNNINPADVMQSRPQQPMGKGGSNVTMPGQGKQPRMGQPNAYSNTIQPWDNASIQPQRQSGKGKGY